jgi:hypothetical protein
MQKQKSPSIIHFGALVHYKLSETWATISLFSSAIWLNFLEAILRTIRENIYSKLQLLFACETTEH